MIITEGITTIVPSSLANANHLFPKQVIYQKNEKQREHETLKMLLFISWYDKLDGDITSKDTRDVMPSRGIDITACFAVGTEAVLDLIKHAA